MDDDLEKLEEVDDVISNVPDEILSAMEEIKFNDKLKLMAFDHKLTVEDSGRFHDLIEGYILGGYEDDEFSKKLSQIVKSPEETVKIGNELNEKILLPLRKQLIVGEFDSMERNGEFDEDTIVEIAPNSTVSVGGNNIEKTTPFSIVGNNLSSSNITTSKESDYSMPKINEAPRKNDPYLEPVDDIKPKI